MADHRTAGAWRRHLGVSLLVGLLVLMVSGLSAGPVRAQGSQLVGLFRISAGYCSSNAISGSYFRMILANGGTGGPYLSNSNSGCSDQTFTPLTPGTDGGLRTGSYQSPPSPPFDASGNARSGTITGPVKFYGTNFATGTSARDPQTGITVSAPVIYDNNGSLSGDLRAFAVTWNNQYFNQGSPKPNAGYPGNTRSLTGSYDATTGRFAIDWTSQIVGGPFNNFTGKWHLEGVFVPAGGSRSTGSGAGSTTTVVGGTSSTRTVTSAASVPAHPGTSVPQPSGSSTSSETAAPAAVATANAASTPVADASSTTTHRVWSVSWPILALAVGLGVLGLVVILLTGRGRTTPGA